MRFRRPDGIEIVPCLHPSQCHPPRGDIVVHPPLAGFAALEGPVPPLASTSALAAAKLDGLENEESLATLRFCTRCRADRPASAFEPGRKTCSKHKKASADVSAVPSPISHSALKAALESAAAFDGVASFETAVLLDELPEQDKVRDEIGDGAGVGVTEEMRVARARCRPLIKLIQESTGYAFVYKDCRSGQQTKFLRSLRYLCAQRTDQDGTKRRSTSRKTELLEESADPVNTASPVEWAAEGSTEGRGAASEAGDVELDTNELAVEEKSVGATAPEADGSKGRGSAWRKGKGKPKVVTTKRKYVSTKVRAPQKKMERYDCRGCIVLKVQNDDNTVLISIAHNLAHSVYVDVVGNRTRAAPKVEDTPVDLDTAVGLPVGSVEVEGDDIFDQTEKTFGALLALVRELKTCTGGGEERVVRRLYEQSRPLRELHTAVSEALENGRLPKKSNGKRTISELGDVVDGERPNPSTSTCAPTLLDLIAATGLNQEVSNNVRLSHRLAQQQQVRYHQRELLRLQLNESNLLFTDEVAEALRQGLCWTSENGGELEGVAGGVPVVTTGEDPYLYIPQGRDVGMDGAWLDPDLLQE